MTWFLALCMLAGSGREFELTASTGTAAGRLVELSAERVVLETPKGPATFPLAQVVRIVPRGAEPPGAAAAQAAGMSVELIDGSLIAARDFQTDGDKARIVSALGEMTVATRSIARVRLQPQSPKLAEQWAEIVEARHPTDVLVLRKQASLDYFTGVVGKIGAETVQFETEGETVDVRRARVEGVLFARPAGNELPSSLCTVVDAGGSRWRIRDVKLAGETMSIVTPAGVAVSLRLDQVEQLQFEVHYLSDLKPEKIEQTPLLAAGTISAAERRFHQPRFNADPRTGPLHLAGSAYEKGLSAFARTELVYRFPEAFSRLQMVVGMDDLEATGASARLVVHGDDRVLYDHVLGGEGVVPLSLDLRGVKRLKILVDFDGNELLGRVNLCEARLLK
ncbi:MAG TPA: NPCBM/NEW2 domain-containing protein [Pirellulales bacterium]|jgi:hypothetical protein|nr:NPCBM/NEW2 domain-containing protein [Pirellulales bacterium]